MKHKPTHQQEAETDMALQALFEQGKVHRRRGADSWEWMQCLKPDACPGCPVKGAGGVGR